MLTPEEIDKITKYVCCPHQFSMPGPEKQALCIKLLQEYLRLREVVNGNSTRN